MELYKSKIKNELGNEIDFSVCAKEIDGVAGVLISIAGPTSLSENHITLAEARELYELLGKVLDSK